MFSKYVLFKKGHLNKRAGVWTPWALPGSATAAHTRNGQHWNRAEPPDRFI